MRLLHKFQSVERIAYAPDLVRKENDVEHSYFLTMFCWYLCDSLQLPYAKEKVLAYALAHDLVETYAGDTYIWDPEAQKTKREREEKARARIENEFPEFVSLHTTIQSYEKQGDPAAVFVRAVDKLLPVLTNYIQNGHAWRVMKVAHEDLYSNKRGRIGEQKEVREMLEQIITILDNNWEVYFPA